MAAGQERGARITVVLSGREIRPGAPAAQRLEVCARVINADVRARSEDAAIGHQHAGPDLAGRKIDQAATRTIMDSVGRVRRRMQIDDRVAIAEPLLRCRHVALGMRRVLDIIGEHRTVRHQGPAFLGIEIRLVGRSQRRPGQRHRVQHRHLFIELAAHQEATVRQYHRRCVTDVIPARGRTQECPLIERRVIDRALVVQGKQALVVFTPDNHHPSVGQHRRGKGVGHVSGRQTRHLRPAAMDVAAEGIRRELVPGTHGGPRQGDGIPLHQDRGVGEQECQGKGIRGEVVQIRHGRDGGRRWRW